MTTATALPATVASKLAQLHEIRRARLMRSATLAALTGRLEEAKASQNAVSAEIEALHGRLIVAVGGDGEEAILQEIRAASDRAADLLEITRAIQGAIAATPKDPDEWQLNHGRVTSDDALEREILEILHMDADIGLAAEATRFRERVLRVFALHPQYGRDRWPDYLQHVFELPVQEEITRAKREALAELGVDL